MRFFRPDLYVRSNSQDFDDSLKAGDEWEASVKEYRRRLKSIRRLLPDKVIEFLDNIFLHDYMITMWVVWEPGFDGPWGGERACSVWLKGSDGPCTVHYGLVRPPRFEPGALPPGLVSTQPCWLYDEFDVEPPGVFTHEILCSDGTVTTLHFKDFDFEMSGLLPMAAKGEPPGTPGERLVPSNPAPEAPRFPSGRVFIPRERVQAIRAHRKSKASGGGRPSSA
jgi:hypothetical protein